MNTSVVDWLIQAGEIAGWGPLELGRVDGQVLATLGPLSAYAKDVPRALLQLLGVVSEKDEIAANLFRTALQDNNQR